MISFEDFVALFNSIKGEPEFEVYFRDIEETYMIIKYSDHVSFQRCGAGDGSGEFDYPSLFVLCHSVSVDGICLGDKWDSIDTIIVNGTFNLCLPDDLAEAKNVFIQ